MISEVIMQNTLNEIFINKPYKIIISNLKDKTSTIKKVTIKPVVIQNQHLYQIESFTDKQAFHENVDGEKCILKIIDYMQTTFKQADIFTDNFVYNIKLSKKDKLFVSKTKNNHTKIIENHNRNKNYILQEGIFIEPLYDLGVMTKDGKIVNAMYDKYKQINRFLEMVDDCLDGVTKLNIIDFGCGKSYLTFVLYYFLKYQKAIDVRIIGLDLKQDVIEKCNKIANKYHYDNLSFEVGDINGYQPQFDIDMVISLHACDTATDHALYNAIKWNAKTILSVPCCQHQINQQIKNDNALITTYGLIKERLSALYTDILRADLLEYCG